MHHSYLNIAQNIRVLFCSNPQGGCGGKCFLKSMGVHFNSDLPELLTISRILPGNFCGFSALKLGGFIILTLGKVFVQLVTVADS